MTPSLRLACASLLLLGLAGAAPADEPKKAGADLEKLEKKIKDLESGLDKVLARLEELEKKLAALKAPDDPKPDPKEPFAKAELLVKEQVAWMNEMADAYEKKDREKIKKLEEKGKEFDRRFNELKLSDGDKKKLEEKYKEDITKAISRLLNATLKADLDPKKDDAKKDK